MKKVLLSLMLVASVSVMTCCTSDDWLEESYNYGNQEMRNGGNMSSGSSATTGELATFNIALDEMSAEPQTTASEYFPDEEDALENNEFTTEMSPDFLRSGLCYVEKFSYLCQKF